MRVILGKEVVYPYISCTYQNLELAHIKVEVAKVGSWTSHVGLRVTFVRRIRGGTCKTKETDTRVSI